MEIDLSEFCKTQSEALTFRNSLSYLSEKVYEADFDLEKNLLEKLGVEKKDKFLSLLNSNKVNTNSNSDLTTFFNKLKDQISMLPVVSLMIAFEPTDKTLKFISDWFILNIKKQVLLEIKVERELIAGIAILVKGRYVDFSIRTAFEKNLHDELSSLSAEEKNTGTLNPDNVN